MSGSASAVHTGQDGPLGFLAGGGEMGELIRAFDWSATAIGSPEAWSPALRTILQVLLANRFPLLLWWGPEYISIYNDAYRPILGRKHPWGLGRPVRECWSEIWDILQPLIDTPFHGGPATWVEDIELQINRSGFLEETHFTIAYSPVPDEAAAGGIGGVLATVHEITDKVIGERRGGILRELGTRAAEANTAEEACQNAAVTLAQFPKDIPFALLYLADADGTRAHLAASAGVADVPEMAETGIQLEHAGGTWPLAMVWHSRSIQAVEELGSHFDRLPPGPWADPPHSAAVVPIRSSIPHQLAGFLVAGLSARLKFDSGYRDFLDLAASQIATSIASARAYEEERRRSEALAEIDRAKTAFFSNVSHEFRTPLTLMLGPLESVLAEEEVLPAAQREQIVTAHRNSLRLLKLVNSLLDFSRIEAGRAKASFAPVDLSLVTADLASNFRSIMESAGLEFVVDCPPLPEPVYVDRDMWEKIVLNLLSNAFKFTFTGRVHVVLEARGRHAVLSVADTGSGIPESQLPHVFERFHRVEGAKGRTYEGTGIGLALIQELVKLHGGTVTASSRPGEGSVFTVTLPFGSAHLPQDRVGAEVSLPAGETALSRAFTGEAATWLARDQLVHPAYRDGGPEVAIRPANRQRILVADDNADMRDHLTRILSVHYQVVAVSDGVAALQVAEALSPDLVLTDVMMPRMDGFALLRELRANSRLGELPVILLSARAGEEARTEGIAAGADDYVTKPFNANELMARVKTTLHLKQLRCEASAQFETLINEAPLGVYVVDSDFRIRLVNPRAKIAFGDLPNLIGRDFDELVHQIRPADYADEVVRLFRHTLETGEPYVVPEQMEAPFSGSPAYSEWRIHRMLVPGGQFGVVCYFQDISVQVLARERIARSEERLARMVAGLTRLHALTGKLGAITDERVGLQAILESALEHHGTDRGLLALYDPERGRLYDGARLGFSANEVERVLAVVPGESASTTAFAECRRVIIEDTESDPQFVSFREITRALGFRAVHSSPIQTADGRCIGVLSMHFADPYRPTNFDIQLTEMHARLAAGFLEQVRAANALRESEVRFRAMANQAPVFIWISGADKRRTWFNDPWLRFTGRAMEVELGDGWTSSIHPEDHARYLEAYARAFDAREEFTTEFRLRRHDGEWRWILDHGLPLRTSGLFAGYIGSCVDITEMKRAEQELRRANSDLEQFAYSASHDLQEPLRAIIIFSELLATRYGDRLDGGALEFLNNVREGAVRMEMLVRDLLTYTQTALVDTAAEATDANQALKGALTNLASAIAESQARIDSDPLPPVPVHHAPLQQLFQNLVGNAIKYRRREVRPTIHISAERQNSEWLFCVSDNGIGIEAKYQESIFGLFQRLHSSREYSGTGLGLAICQRIVERCRGRIWVESEPVTGSKFYFTLPVC